MTISRATPVLVAVFSFLALGCDDGGGGGSNGPLTLEQFKERLATTSCALREPCCVSAGGTFDDGECYDQVVADIEEDEEAAEDGSATFDEVAAGQCLDHVETIGCNFDLADLLELVDRCNVWRGTLSPGDECTDGIQCANVESSASGCVNDRCVAVERVGIGEECGLTAFCDPLTADCQEMMCVALPGEGDECTGDCAPGFYCAEDTCVPKLDVGSDCAANSQCIGDFCIDGKCVSALVGDQAAEGEPEDCRL